MTNPIGQPELDLRPALRSIQDVNADMERLRAEREQIIEAMNAHRTENKSRAYSIAEVAERIKHFATAHPDEEMRIWMQDNRTGNLKAVVGVHSWRGNYSEPAIGGSDYGFDKTREDGSKFYEQFTAKLALRRLEDLTIDTFEGYKGGDYQYDPDDTLYLDDHGHYSGTHVIVGVIEFTPEPGTPHTIGADGRDHAGELGLMLVGLDVDA